MSDDSSDAAPDDVRIDALEVGDREVVVISAPHPDVSARPELTEAEAEVAALVFEGLSNAEVAEARDVAPRTVANQLRSIYRKLGVRSRAELVATLLDDDPVTD